MRVSRRFIESVKLADTPAYRLALAAGLHPSTLSKLLHGATPIIPDDERVIAIGRVLGLPAEECFEGLAEQARRAGAAVAAEGHA